MPIMGIEEGLAFTPISIQNLALNFLRNMMSFTCYSDCFNFFNLKSVFQNQGQINASKCVLYYETTHTMN